MKYTLLYCNGKKWFRTVGCLLLFLFAATGVKAQVTVEATIDSLQLLIGEQTKVRLQVSMDANQRLRLPVVRDTLVTGSKSLISPNRIHNC